MSNVINFLESLGADAQLRHATGAELEQALANAQIDPAVAAAIFDADQQRLRELLGAQTSVCCLVHAPEDDEDEDEEDDEPAEDEDDQDDEPQNRAIAAG